MLCDLEGLTYNQAADQLRWTVPTLRCRLARARQRLKGRLMRRGFAAPALGAALAAEGGQSGGTAGVDPVDGARGDRRLGLVRVVLLTQALLREMLMTKIKFATTAALAALALASAGVIAAGGPRPDDAKPAMKPKAAPAEVIREKPAAEKPLETVEIKGRVVAPDGRPVAGAGDACTSTRTPVHRHGRRAVAQNDQRLRWAVLDPPAQARARRLD